MGALGGGQGRLRGQVQSLQGAGGPERGSRVGPRGRDCLQSGWRGPSRRFWMPTRPRCATLAPRCRRAAPPWRHHPCCSSLCFPCGASARCWAMCARLVRVLHSTGGSSGGPPPVRSVVKGHSRRQLKTSPIVSEIESQDQPGGVDACQQGYRQRHRNAANGIQEHLQQQAGVQQGWASAGGAALLGCTAGLKATHQ